MQQFIMVDQLGESWYYQAGESYSTETEPTALCRCGASHGQPYCDGHHTQVEWDDRLTASLEPLLESAEVVEGEDLTLSDNEKYCVYARFCHPGGGAWRLTLQSGAEEAKKEAIREASLCPSARLVAFERGGDVPYEFDFEPSVALLEDPQIGVSSGLWLRGGIPFAAKDGAEYEVRNRVVLCRCGGSHNKPYCDGSHATLRWHDGLPGLESADLQDCFPEEELAHV